MALPDARPFQTFRAHAAMEIGAMITDQSMTPAQLGDAMRSRFGPGGPGSRGELQALEWLWGPLAGSPPR